MKNAKPISNDLLQNFEKSYNSNKLNKVMTNALAKNAIGTIAYVQSSQENTQHQFSIDIPTMTATNQKSSGRCWIFAGLNVLREIVATKNNIESFELSQNYTAFWDKFEKINYFLESVIALADRPVDDRTLCWVLQNGIGDGGQWDMLVSVIKKYGVVPKSAMPETFQSSNTGAMNHLINAKLRKDAVILRKLAAAGVCSCVTHAEKDKMLEEFYRFLCMNFGVPPKTFAFEFVDKDKAYHIERDLTPQTFCENYIGDILDEYVSIIHAPTQDKPFGKTYTVDFLGNAVDGNEITYLNLEMDTFKEIVLSQLKEREVVWFGSDCGTDGDRDSGVWDDGAYDYETAFDMKFDMTKEEKMDYRHSAMNHAMVITGVNLDAAGKSTKWKIENSWSDEKGNKGYFLMTDSWFDQYVYQAVVNKKYLSEAQLAALAQEPIHLNPWDPMGTLAD